MLRAVLLFTSLSLVACSSCRSRQAPSPAPTTTAVSTPAPPAAPAAPTAHDLLLAGPVVPSGTVAFEVAEAEARSSLAPMRECARLMPIDTVFTARYALNDEGAVREVTIEGTLAAPVEECVRRVARELRFTITAPGGIPVVVVPMRAIERPDGVAIDPSLACSTSDECVFVTGSCTKPFVVHRLHAASLDRLRRQVLAAESCLRTEPTVGYEAVCHRGMCTDHDLPLDDLACSSDAQCAAVVLPSGEFLAASRPRARDVATRRNGRVATPADSAPAVSCQYGACLLKWSGQR